MSGRDKREDCPDVTMTASEEARPIFFSAEDFPVLATLTPHLAVLQEEARGVANAFRYLRWRYGRFERRARGYAEGARASFCWRTYGLDLPRNRAICPRTAALVDAVPGLVTSGFYLLDAHSRILPHVGVSSDIRRAHMGIFCPPGCGIRVADEKREWREGEFLVFDDTYDHEVWNDSDELRCILLVDFLRDGLDLDAFTSDLRARFIVPMEYSLLREAGADVPAHGGVPAEERAIIEQHGLFFA